MILSQEQEDIRGAKCNSKIGISEKKCFKNKELHPL